MKPELPSNSRDYRNLQPSQIVDTIDVLSRRIKERFPQSGLFRVAVELHALAQEAVVRAEKIRRPNILLRGFVLLLIGLVVALVAMTARSIRLNNEVFQLEHFVQTIDSSISSVVFLGAAIVFLFSLELKLKRKRALEAVRELRSLAHIIDMHQLTKDPERVTGRGAATASSPKRTMTAFELGRYLDYCSELLSLLSKTGALYVQEFPDPVAIEAVDQVSNLATDLSRNIWQKIMILEATTRNTQAAAEKAAAFEKPATATDAAAKAVAAQLQSVASS
ncbi:MAG: hypothetical protein JNK76_21345 [Planctomycetales bacterium]|nr:hypothetical protein [Planctomycetales bacterium]MBN8626374.1 hypothetical protein [Planctomycetota bacterium]